VFCCILSIINRTFVFLHQPQERALEKVGWTCPIGPRTPVHPVTTSLVEQIRVDVSTGSMYTSPRGDDVPR